MSHDSTSTLHTTYHMTLHPLYTPCVKWVWSHEMSPHITWLYIHFTHHLSHDSTSTLHTIYHKTLHLLYKPYIIWFYIHVHTVNHMTQAIPLFTSYHMAHDTMTLCPLYTSQHVSHDQMPIHTTYIIITFSW